MKILVYRHLPSLDNLKDMFIGHRDVECDNDYIIHHSKDINLIQQSLSCYKEVYISPLKRTKITADYFVPNARQVVDKRLIERDLGSWSGIEKEYLRKQYPEGFYSDGRFNHLYHPENGESFSSIVLRTYDFLQYVLKKHNRDNVLVITHNGVITTLKCLYGKKNSTENIKPQDFLMPYEIEVDEVILDEIGSFINARI